MTKITEKIMLDLSHHSMVRSVERLGGKASKIVKSLTANIEDVKTFIEYNVKYDGLMMHDSNREVCYVLAFSMYHGKYVASVVTIPPYKEHNWAKPDTLLWECKH